MKGSVSAPLSDAFCSPAMLSFELLVRACVCSDCVHCPQRGSDDSMFTSQDALMFEPFYLISCETAEQNGGWVVGHRWCDWWGGFQGSPRQGGSTRQADRQTGHQLCLSSVVCAGIGMWPKTTSTSSSGTPSTDIRAADLFEPCAIVPWQMEGPDRLLRQTNAHVNTHAANFTKLSAARDKHQEVTLLNSSLKTHGA